MGLPSGRHAVYADFAAEVADGAGERLLTWFGQASADTKADGSYVTEADLEVDVWIQQAVADRFPDHGVLTEETVHIYGGAEFTWVIDPLDGTTNFAHGLAHWGTSMALLQHGEPILGLLHFPLLNQRFVALRGEGAYLNGQPIRVRPPANLDDNQFFTTDSRAFRLLEVNLPAKPRILGSAAYDMAAVAGGMAIACLEITPKAWDLAASWLIAQEAGAVIAPLLAGVDVFPLQTAKDYRTRIYPLLVAASPELWRQMRSALRVRAGSDHFLRQLQAQGWIVDLV